MKELAVRAASGAMYVALVLGAAFIGPWAVAALFLPAAALAAHEWHALAWKGNKGAPPAMRTVALAVLAYAIGAAAPLLPEPRTAWVLALLVALAAAAFAQLLGARPAQAVAVAGGDLATMLLIGLPMACAPWLAGIGQAFIGFMLLLWANDTGAYLVGSAIGRHRLLPAVSPGKTWEGLLGGAIAAVGAAWAVALWVDHELPPRAWLIAAPVVTLCSTIGDLLESAFKRAAGVKDSGRIMPGHGGILDRFDGYLLAAPAMAALAWIALA